MKKNVSLPSPAQVVYAVLNETLSFHTNRPLPKDMEMCFKDYDIEINFINPEIAMTEMSRLMSGDLCEFNDLFMHDITFEVVPRRQGVSSQSLANQNWPLSVITDLFARAFMIHPLELRFLNVRLFETKRYLSHGSHVYQTQGARELYSACVGFATFLAGIGGNREAVLENKIVSAVDDWYRCLCYQLEPEKRFDVFTQDHLFDAPRRDNYAQAKAILSWMANGGETPEEDLAFMCTVGLDTAVSGLGVLRFIKRGCPVTIHAVFPVPWASKPGLGIVTLSDLLNRTMKMRCMSNAVLACQTIADIINHNHQQGIPAMPIATALSVAEYLDRAAQLIEFPLPDTFTAVTNEKIG